MTWTDERVALLKKLWMDGLSASQIAAELSGGVTRNAVIGKVHRLKLSARAKPSGAVPRPKPPRPAPRRTGAAPMAGPGRPGPAMSASAISQRRTAVAPMIGATALRIEETQEVAIEVNPKTAELFIPVESRIGLLQLTEKTCKWPIGDPVAADFHFCGRPSDEGKPYCEFHARRAFHQIERKKR